MAVVIRPVVQKPQLGLLPRIKNSGIRKLKRATQIVSAPILQLAEEQAATAAVYAVDKFARSDYAISYVNTAPIFLASLMLKLILDIRLCYISIRFNDMFSNESYILYGGGITIP
jgi:hypothetical protein